ncbi:MAG: DUF1343 domain-containing protein [Candidatus Rokubacteria bacterium]|nr:DUF1343 domain-containing protein [Candidatus Rokubacteria bacterium]
MRRVSALPVVFLLLALGIPAAAHSQDFSAVDQAALDAVNAGEIPGAVILVGQGERVLYRKAFGLRSLLPAREPMTEDTIFDVASLTKVMATAPAVLLLVEQEKVSLDAPLARYLTEFKGRKYRELTIRRILTHTAGLGDLPPAEALRERFPKTARALAEGALQYPPGGGFRYSDTGFILLGELVRRVSGEPLDRFVARRLFEPLGMRDSAFNPDPRVSSRIAPTEVVNDGLLWGRVHDGNARLLGGVAGHAGLFSTADDLARFCQMLVSDGRFQGAQILAPATVRTMLSPLTVGEVTRALGWDMASPFSRPLGPFFPHGSVGHTGFTGTALWVDPPSRSYLVLLTNRVHPYGKGRVGEIRMRVAAAVGAALFAPPLPRVEVAAAQARVPAADAPAAPREPTQSGLDVLAAQQFSLLRGRSVGLVTNQTGVDARRRRGIDLIARARGVMLKAIFAPEHGLTGQATQPVPHARDRATGLPVWSLYGAERRPTPSMLDGIDTLVFDIQDVGIRYYTYLTTLVYLLEEGARRNIRVVVLDRPNPLTGKLVEGPMMDPDLRSFTAPHPLPVRTGLTIGEFAKLVVAERSLPVSLTVIPLGGWERSRWYDETGLAWINPSPNIRSLHQALLYAGIGLLEPTNLSVGRGTAAPFEVVGAPWIAPIAVAEAMNAKGLAGVSFFPVYFTPAADKYAREHVGGVRLVVTDREAVRPVAVALALARALRERYPTEFRPEAIQNLLVNRSTMWAFLRGEPLMRILDWAEVERADFLQRRQSHLIYR